jgi:transposase
VIPQGVEIFLAVEPVDMRLGFERLGGLVRERMAREPRCRALFVFFGRRRQTVKVLTWDGTGVVLIYKKLDRGLFELPLAEPGNEQVATVSEATFEAIFAGLQTRVPTPTIH